MCNIHFLTFSIQGNISQIDEIPADKVDVALINLHALMQEYSDKQPVFNALYTEIKDLTLKNSREENKPLHEGYSILVENYKDVEPMLLDKKRALEKWAELLNWHGEQNLLLSHMKYQADNQKLEPEEINATLAEIGSVVNKLITWKENAPKIDSVKALRVVDKQSGLPLNADHLVREIEVKAINLKSQLGEKLDGLEKLKRAWKDFEDAQRKVEKEFDDSRELIAEITGRVKTPGDIEYGVKELDKLLEDLGKKIGSREDLRKQGQELMKEDLKNVSLIQNIVSVAEMNHGRIEDEVKEKKLLYNDVLLALDEVKEVEEKVTKEIGRIEEICLNLPPASDVTQANLNHEKAKKALDSLKKTKIMLDKLDSKAEALVRKSGSIPQMEPEIKKQLQVVHSNWSRVYENLVKLVQRTESQAIIWKNLDETKNNLFKWLQEQDAAISSSLEKPNEVEVAQAKLTKYKEELPSFLRLKESIPTKHAQLSKISSDGEEIQTLKTLLEVLNKQFEQVAGKAKKLEEVSKNFGEKEKGIKSEMKRVSNNVNALRENVIKCEDLSGDNSKILERLLKVQKLREELIGSGKEITGIEKQIQDLKEIYPSFIDANLTKEHQLLKKRLDGVIGHSEKVENSLLSFLKKFHNEKYSALQRIVSANKEKVQWCMPEPGSDRYNLDVKLNSLEPVKNVLEDCERRKIELENSIGILQEVESPETVRLLKAEKDHLLLELGDLKENFEKTKEILERNIGLHGKYEEMSEGISAWLKETENKVRAESATQLNLNTVDQKIEEVKNLQKHVDEYKKNFANLSGLGDELAKELPETRLSQFVQHLQARYQAVVKFLAGYLDKLHELNKYKTLYKDSVNDVENWLGEAKATVDSFKKLTASGSKPDQANLEELKNFASEREKGQTLLNRAVEHGEALFSGILPENRDAIRTELRNLRDRSEALIDEVNNIYKQVETILMQRHSFNDSLAQIKTWIEEAEVKLGDKKLYATLPEKKQALQNYRTTAQDVNLHKNILKQIKEKVEELQDAEANDNLNESLSSYNKLSKEINARLEETEKHVSNHEAYLQTLEKCKDWLGALTSEAALLVDESSMETPEAKLAIVENLLGQKPEGDKILSSCKQLLETVLNQTAPEGHPPLIKGHQEQERAWKLFLDLCTEAKTKLNELHSRYSEFEKIIEDLEGWLKQKEAQVKDQSLRSTHKTKLSHLQKLKGLEEEISSRGQDFARAADLSQKVETDTDLAGRISQIVTRYQSLKNSAKEGINRYEIFVEEHKTFDEDYNDFLKWLTDREEDLQKLSHIVGDLTVLQDRQQKIKELLESRNQKSEDFENILDRGEKLYSHTSPDGREIIRQQLRNLRTIWDGFTDDLQNCTNKLDQCLIQFNDFSATQEQLTKWLKDVEKAMHQHTELKSTLQEKRAQLQNHKIMHQEITSHQQLVGAVCDKAQQLVDQTQDKSLNIYLQSIKQLYHNIVLKSEELLKNLGDCAENHNQFNNLVNGFKDWLGGEREKLQEFEDIGGEKGDIVRRLNGLDILKDGEAEGNRLLGIVGEKMVLVAKSTTAKGVEQLKKEVENLRDLLKRHLLEIGEWFCFFTSLYSPHCRLQRNFNSSFSLR